MKTFRFLAALLTISATIWSCSPDTADVEENNNDVSTAETFSPIKRNDIRCPTCR